MIAFGAALTVALLAGLAEWLHARRGEAVRGLAFGPDGHPSLWTHALPYVRCAALAAMTWGLITLLLLKPKIASDQEIPDAAYRHLVIALDVSPSMKLKDAGPERNLTRSQRASDALMSVLERIAIDQVRVSIVAFYTGALPVVVDTFDLNVVRNILDDLPLELAFDVGKTTLLEGVRESVGLAKPWPPGSTTLIVVSDGDTIPDTGFPDVPRSIADRLVVGVGDPYRGTFIDSHQSRQDVSTLSQLAHRLGGNYVDANEKHVPSTALADLAKAGLLKKDQDVGSREWALISLLCGAGLLALISPALALAGSAWHSKHRLPIHSEPQTVTPGMKTS